MTQRFQPQQPRTFFEARALAAMPAIQRRQALEARDRGEEITDTPTAELPDHIQPHVAEDGRLDIVAALEAGATDAELTGLGVSADRIQAAQQAVQDRATLQPHMVGENQIDVQAALAAGVDAETLARQGVPQESIQGIQQRAADMATVQPFLDEEGQLTPEAVDRVDDAVLERLGVDSEALATARQGIAQQQAFDTALAAVQPHIADDNQLDVRAYIEAGGDPGQLEVLGITQEQIEQATQPLPEAPTPASLTIPTPPSAEPTIPEPGEALLQLAPDHVNRLSRSAGIAQSIVIGGARPGQDPNNAMRLAQQRANEAMREFGFDVAGLRTRYNVEINSLERQRARAQFRLNNALRGLDRNGRPFGPGVNHEQQVELMRERLADREQRIQQWQQARQEFEQQVNATRQVLQSQVIPEALEAVRRTVTAETLAPGVVRADPTRTTAEIQTALEGVETFADLGEAIQEGRLTQAELTSIGFSVGDIQQAQQAAQQAQIIARTGATGEAAIQALREGRATEADIAAAFGPGDAALIVRAAAGVPISDADTETRQVLDISPVPEGEGFDLSPRQPRALALERRIGEVGVTDALESGFTTPEELGRIFGAEQISGILAQERRAREAMQQLQGLGLADESGAVQVTDAIAQGQRPLLLEAGITPEQIDTAISQRSAMARAASGLSIVEETARLGAESELVRAGVLTTQGLDLLAAREQGIPAGTLIQYGVAPVTVAIADRAITENQFPVQRRAAFEQQLGELTTVTADDGVPTAAPQRVDAIEEDTEPVLTQLRALAAEELQRIIDSPVRSSVAFLTQPQRLVDFGGQRAEQEQTAQEAIATVLQPLAEILATSMTVAGDAEGARQRLDDIRVGVQTGQLSIPEAGREAQGILAERPFFQRIPAEVAVQLVLFSPLARGPIPTGRPLQVPQLLRPVTTARAAPGTTAVPRTTPSTITAPISPQIPATELSPLARAQAEAAMRAVIPPAGPAPRMTLTRGAIRGIDDAPPVLRSDVFDPFPAAARLARPTTAPGVLAPAEPVVTTGVPLLPATTPARISVIQDMPVRQAAAALRALPRVQQQAVLRGLSRPRAQAITEEMSALQAGRVETIREFAPRPTQTFRPGRAERPDPRDIPQFQDIAAVGRPIPLITSAGATAVSPQVGDPFVSPVEPGQIVSPSGVPLISTTGEPLIQEETTLAPFLLTTAAPEAPTADPALDEPEIVAEPVPEDDTFDPFNPATWPAITTVEEPATVEEPTTEVAEPRTADPFAPLEPEHETFTTTFEPMAVPESEPMTVTTTETFEPEPLSVPETQEAIQIQQTQEQIAEELGTGDRLVPFTTVIAPFDAPRRRLTDTQVETALETETLTHQQIQDALQSLQQLAVSPFVLTDNQLEQAQQTVTQLLQQQLTQQQFSQLQQTAQQMSVQQQLNTLNQLAQQQEQAPLNQQQQQLAQQTANQLQQQPLTVTQTSTLNRLQTRLRTRVQPRPRPRLQQRTPTRPPTRPTLRTPPRVPPRVPPPRPILFGLPDTDGEEDPQDALNPVVVGWNQGNWDIEKNLVTGEKTYHEDLPEVPQIGSRESFTVLEHGEETPNTWTRNMGVVTYTVGPDGIDYSAGERLQPELPPLDMPGVIAPPPDIRYAFIQDMDDSERFADISAQVFLPTDTVEPVGEPPPRRKRGGSSRKRNKRASQSRTSTKRNDPPVRMTWNL